MRETWDFSMPLAEAMTTQRAVRRLKPDPVDDALVLRLIELALKALTSLEERDQAIAAQWHRRVERARYEADLAERRYEDWLATERGG